MGNADLLSVLAILLAALATGLFLWALFCLLRPRRRQPAHLQRPSGGAAPGNYAVALRCIVWVLAVKLATMLLAYALFGRGTDFFADAPALFERSDCHHYLDIAAKGYVTTGESGLYIVFFPLYPYLLRALSLLTGEYFWTGSLFSMACTAGAGYQLYQLTRQEYGPAAAARALRYFFLFPAISFALLPFSEGLFLLLSISCMRALRSRHFAAAGLLGLLAALTRSLGVLLAVPLLVQAAGDARREQGEKPLLRGVLKRAWPALLIALGTLIYLGINWRLFGDPLHFMTVQREHWNQNFDALPHTVWYLVKNIGDFPPQVSLPLWVGQLAFIFAMLPSVAGVCRRQPRAYGAYTLLLFYFSISVSWLLSAPRYLFALFPCMMLWAEAADKRWKDALLTLVLGALALAFACGMAAGLDIY